MITLAFDTATPAPSLALLEHDEPILEHDLPADAAAGRRVAHEIHLLLLGAGIGLDRIDRIIVGVGPGGFTGLRIGIATALGLGQACGVPVVGASSLEALAAAIAAAVPSASLLVPVIDAKRREVFAAAYRFTPEGLQTVVEPVATTAAGLDELLTHVAVPGGGAWIAGDGLARWSEAPRRFTAAVPDDPAAHAVRAVHLAGRVRDGASLAVSPLYLRLPDAEVNRLRREREGAAA